MRKAACLVTAGLASLSLAAVTTWLADSLAAGLAVGAAALAASGLGWLQWRIWQTLRQQSRALRQLDSALKKLKTITKDVRRYSRQIERLLEDQHPDQRKLEQRLARLTAATGIAAAQTNELINRLATTSPPTTNQPD